MQALSIHPDSNEIKEIDIEMKANTTYTFFNSILIDEITTLQKHLVFTDSNALSEGKTAYFLGEQLLIGKALIIGKIGLQESDVTIPLDTLKELVNYDIPIFYKNVLSLLVPTDIDVYKTFTLVHNDEKITLSLEWVLYTFNIADDKTKEYFIAKLKEALLQKHDIFVYMQKMAQLALNASSSQ